MQLTGLIAAPHTPTREDFTLNLDQVPLQASHLATLGNSGVFVGGTTGECHSFSTEERMAVIGAWGEVAHGAGLKFVAHVGHNNLPDIHRLVEASQTAGADAIAVMAPTFFKPPDAAALAEWCVRVAEPAPNLPFYFYDIPALTGVKLDTTEVIQRLRERLPSFAGVKFTNPDTDLFARCMKAGAGLNLLFGVDEMMLSGLKLGSPGAVGSSYNYAAPLYLKIIAAHEDGDTVTAELWQARAAQMIEVIAAHTYNPAAKAVMAMAGVDCGPARPPQRAVPEEEREELRAELEALDFWPEIFVRRVE